MRSTIIIIIIDVVVVVVGVEPQSVLIERLPVLSKGVAGG